MLENAPGIPPGQLHDEQVSGATLHRLERYSLSCADEKEFEVSYAREIKRDTKKAPSGPFLFTYVCDLPECGVDQNKDKRYRDSRDIEALRCTELDITEQHWLTRFGLSG